MASVRAPATLTETTVARPRTWSLAGVLVAPATMVVILALSLLLLMTPFWTHLAMSVSGGSNALATPDMAYRVSDDTVAELLLGPGTFAAFDEAEGAHMRDVRVVLLSFLGIAGLSAVFISWSLWRHGRHAATWRSIARGGLLLSAIVLVLGLFAAVAFGVAFELFHRILFPGGNWAFPADSLLIRLYPYGFWQLSAAALGVLAISTGVITWFVARRRARSDR